MPVPRRIQLQRGTSVNIVLKADQPTGKLTTGAIEEFLTRGDHPRGIKVRLSDGQVGRVQSIASNTRQTGITSQVDGAPFATHRLGPSAGRFQHDVRTEEQPEEDASLLDYVKIKPAKKSKAKRRNVEVPGEEAETPPENTISDAVAMQSRLEAEFPNLDPALIAAILNDHDCLEAARDVLASLS